MSISELGSLGEFIASIVTLATLVYLATQVRQAKHEFRQSTRERLADRPAEIQLAWLSSEALSSTMSKALLTNEKLTPRGGVPVWVPHADFLWHFFLNMFVFKIKKNLTILTSLISCL